MFWENFINNNGKVSFTGVVTCEWVNHPLQRSQIINDGGGGGIYLYKRYYNISEPIIFKWTRGNLTNEIKHYERFLDKFEFDETKGLKILLVGELAYNPERVYALEQRGHKLFGLWLNNPSNLNAIGPLPFGNIEDIPFDNYQQRIEEIRPDIIYAGLNYQAVPLAH